MEQKNPSTATPAALYASAYAMQYGEKNLPVAFKQYRALMASYPEATEAGYSKAQLHNIVNVMVPNEALHDAMAKLVEESTPAE